MNDIYAELARVGAHLRQRLDDAGIPVAKAARDIGVPESTLRDHLKSGNLTVVELWRLADLLDADISDLWAAGSATIDA